jgi:hypothetical protein
MGFFDFFSKIGKAIVKGGRRAIRFVGKTAKTIRHIARGVRKAAKVVGRIPFLRAPAQFIGGIAGTVEEGAEIAGDVAGGLQQVDRELRRGRAR